MYRASTMQFMRPSIITLQHSEARHAVMPFLSMSIACLMSAQRCAKRALILADAGIASHPEFKDVVNETCLMSGSG